MSGKQDEEFVLLILHSAAAADKMEGECLFVVLLSAHLKGR